MLKRRALSKRALYRLAAAFTRSNSDAVVQRKNKDLAVANFSRGPSASALDDRVNRRLYKAVVHGDHQLHFAEQIHGEFVPLIEHLGLPFLPAETLAIHDR